MASDGKQIVRRYEQLKSIRGEWERIWQELKDLVRPGTNDFYTRTVRGDDLWLDVYDGTAPWALEQLAAGLNSYLTSPTQRWFTLRLTWRQQLSEEELAYLEAVADELYHCYSMPNTNLAPSIHETYMDLAAFGTGVLYQDYDIEKGTIKFKSFPLSICYVGENSDGVIDTLGVVRKMTALQMLDKFGDDTPPKVTESMEKQPDREFDVLHMVYPRKDKVAYGNLDSKKAFTSVWVFLDDQSIIREGGYDAFPYHVPRWTKLSGETYGRSPAMSCAPDIRMVNTMMKTIIKSAQKITDPPLVVPNDGFMLPLKTSPSSLIYKEPGTEPIVPLETRGRVDIGLEMVNVHREHIVKSFFVDWIIRSKKKERQSMMEISDDREEILRQMAPMLGRIQTEMLGPMIARSLDLLARAGRLPDPPESMVNADYEITYISPAAVAQYGGKAMSIQRFVQDMAQLASVMPQVMDKISPDDLADEMARLRDVSPRVLRTQEQVDAQRQQQAQQQAMQQQVAMGGEMASALKDASVASKNFEG